MAVPRPRTLEDVDASLASAVLDPTGSTIGTVLALLGAAAALVVLLRWWFQNRGR